MALYRESTVTEKNKNLHTCLFSSKNQFSQKILPTIVLWFSRQIFLIINYQLSIPRVSILELFMPTFTRNFPQGFLTGNFLLQGYFCSIFNGLTNSFTEKICGNSITINTSATAQTGWTHYRPLFFHSRDKLNFLQDNLFSKIHSSNFLAFHGHFNETLLCQAPQIHSHFPILLQATGDCHILIKNIVTDTFWFFPGPSDNILKVTKNWC